jgi:SEC-C motif-containing protein
MRSRYAAYALGLTDYILATTHPDGPHFQEDRAAWTADVDSFCKHTRFRGLKIVHRETAADRAWVTFHATLEQAGRDASFTEKSLFLKSGGRWTYHSGEPG